MSAEGTAAVSSTGRSVPVAAQPDLAELEKRYVDANNRGDSSAAAALFSADATFQDRTCDAFPDRTCKGELAILRAIERGIANHTKLTLLGPPRTVGNSISSRLELRDDSLSELLSAGVERIVVTATTEVREGKFVSRQVRVDVSDPQTSRFISHLLSSVSASRTRERQ